MNKKDKLLSLKILAIVLSLAIIISFYLFFARKIPTAYFWIVVIICAGMGYLVIPRLRQKIESS